MNFLEKGIFTDYLGRFFRENQLIDEALEAFKKHIMDNPKEIMGYKEISFTLQTQKRFEESLKYAEIVNKLKADDPYGYFLKGQLYVQLEKHDLAIKNFEEAVRLKPENNVYYNQLGLSYGEVKNYDKMIECFEKAYSIAPKTIYLNNLADANIKKKDFEKAEEYLKRCIEAEPNYAMAWSNYAEICDEMGKTDEALEKFSKAIEIEPNNLVFRVHRGNLYKKLEKNKEALDDYETVSELSKDQNSTGNVFITKYELARILKDVETKKEELNKILNEVDDIHKDLDSAIKQMQNKQAQSQLLDMFKQLQEQKDKVQQEQQLSSKLEAAELIKQESQKMMERLLKTEKKLAKQYQILKKSGAVDLAYVNDEFSKLKETMDLYNYGKVFYWTLLNYFGAYRALSTNLQQGNHEHEAVMNDKHSTILDGMSKVTKFVGAACEGIPIVGSVIGIMDKIISGVSEFSKREKFQNRVNAINRIIMYNQDDNSLEQGLSTTIGKASVDLAKKKKKFTGVDGNGKLVFKGEKKSGFSQWFNDSISSLKKTLSGEEKVSLYDSPAAVLALKDVTLVLSYMYEHHEEILKCGKPLDKQIVKMVTKGDTEKLLLKAAEDEKRRKENGEEDDDEQDLKKHEKARCSCACLIF